MFREKYVGKVYSKEYMRLSGITEWDFKRWLLPIAAARLTEWVSDNERKQLLKLIRTELINEEL